VTSEGRQIISQDELRLAEEELRAADQLIAIGLYRIALTRAYFAAFHAARSVLYARNLEPKTHQGVMTLFNQHVIRPGQVEPKAARVLARLQKFREQADYAEAFVVDLQGAQEELAAAREFVTAALALV
jgi:uncharacterized protein (UPF0332 family)